VFVKTSEDRVVAAGDSVAAGRWRAEFDALMGRIAARFCRVEPRRTARAYVTGLLSGIERKNCWWLAEHAGLAGPQAMQRLVRSARWDADEVRDEVRRYVIDRLGGDDGVLIVDETGFVKKGPCSAGVQRQYTGTAGRIENAQVGVFLAYASARGRALIDRRLYLPKNTWLADRERCQAAGVPEGALFATKPALAAQMITSALAAGVPAAWASGDEVYGQDPHLRAVLEEAQIGYVLTIAGNRRAHFNGADVPVADITTAAAPRHWHRYSAGAGAKGPRYYDWAWTPIDPHADGHRWLLIRRHPTTGELAYYRCYAPRPVPLLALVRVAGIRWSIEETFQTAKGQVGLDHYQVRTWTGWHRHVTLAMLALAFLAVIATTSPPATRQTIALTMPEIRRLLATIVFAPNRLTSQVLHWSQWRRRHQAKARQCHYQRRSQS
jgi:SRSO17 transposase